MMFEKKPEAALFGFPGLTQMVGSRMATPSKIPRRVMSDSNNSTHRLLRAVGREWRRVEVVIDRFRVRRTENCD